MEKLFCVKPKSNPDQIKVQLSGAKSITVNEEGQLEVETELGPVKFTKPIAYQEIDGKRVEVPVEYRIQDVGWVKRSAPNKNDFNGLNRWNDFDGFASLNPSYPLCGDFCWVSYLNPTYHNSLNQSNISSLPNPHLDYGFKVASYDKTKPLIIDPLLASTYLGGSNFDFGSSLTLDTSGNVYVTGLTYSSDFPATSGAYDTSYNGGDYDVFVSKLDSGLTSLLASTYLGGSSEHEDECGNSLAIDTSGNVYVTGYTESTDFPTTSGAYDTSYGGSDVFVSKFDSDLSADVTPTPTPTPTPVETPTPTPSGCNGETTIVETDTVDFELLKQENKVVTVTVTDAGGCPVADEKVSAKVNGAGKKRVKISPSSKTTDENGAAAFTITAKKKTDNAKVTFKSGGIKERITVTVVSE